MDQLISVIVPVYKTEKYLRKCVDSILNQTYKKLEIILVNDGSPDNSGKICDEYAKKDRRIIVIHQKNSGISTVMNKGLDIAKGSYIATVDSDDNIHEQMLEILYNNLKNFEADISVCSYSLIYEGNVNKDSQQQGLSLREESIKVFTSKEALGKLYGGMHSIDSFAWNKLYKKELFDNIRFLEGKMYEDMFIIHRLLDSASKVVVSDLPLYYYLQRSDSITGKPFNFSNLEILAALEERMILLEEREYVEEYNKTYEVFLDFAFDFYYLAEKHYPDEKGRIREIKNIFIKLYKQHDNKQLSKRTKVKYELFCISPFLLKVILNLKVFIYNNLLRNFYKVQKKTF